MGQLFATEATAPADTAQANEARLTAEDEAIRRKAEAAVESALGTAVVRMQVEAVCLSVADC